MAIMIPPEIPEGARVSEKMIFETLKIIAEARDWVVLHSIEIPQSENPEGLHKIDFVILMPKYASVICLEVVDEDCQFDANKNKWSISSSEESPLDQAQYAMEALKKHFENPHFLPDSQISLGYGVVFTDGTQIEVTELPEHLDSMFQAESSKRLTVMTDASREFEDALNPDYERSRIDALDPNTLGQVLVLYAKDHLHDLSEWEGWEAPDKAQLLALNNFRNDVVSLGGIIEAIATIFHDNLETHRPQLLRLMEDQLQVLQLVGCQPPSAISTESDDQITSSDNIKEQPRVVVDGAAGTGKTVLAKEIAKQRCEAGEIVGLLCSNPYLSQRFEKWAETLSRDNGGKVIAGTPASLPSLIISENEKHAKLAAKHQQRLEDLKKSDDSTDIEGALKLTDLEGSLKFGYLDDHWQQFITETIEDLNTLEQGALFDYLIVDEAQNLCAEMFLNLQNALLKDGLKNGRWIMFGDFENQNIVSPEIEQNGKDSLKSFGDLNREDAWKDAKLETNCRNTDEITEKTFKLVEIESPSMSGVYGPHVQIEYFKSQEELNSLIDGLLQGWEKRRFQSSQIILLSSGTGGEFDTKRDYSGWQLLNIGNEPSPGQDKTLKYSDVYDFQGLESDLAILVLPKTEDMFTLAGRLTLRSENHLNRVLYIGMSRAKAMLVILADELWKDTLDSREFLYDKRKELQQTR